MKKTLVAGASPNPQRYAYLAAERLLKHRHEVVLVGLRKGEINGLSIQTDYPAVAEVDTVTLYVGPAHQAVWMDYILGLHPKRIIFNPGTENPMFEKRARERGIETIEACTLVMLATGTY